MRPRPRHLILEPLALICLDPHGRMQAETVDVNAQRLADRTLPRHRTPEAQHLPTRARVEGEALGDGHRLQWSQRAHLLAVGIRLGQAGLAHLLDQHAPGREQLHEPGDDGQQQ